MSELQRTGRITIHSTTVSAWEEHYVDDTMRSSLAALIVFLRKRGFTAQMDPNTVKNYPSIARGHWLVCKGDLQASIKLCGRHLSAEFFQEINVSNPNGGRYDFDKFHRMPRTMQLMCIVEVTAIVRKLESIGYTFQRKNGDVVALDMLGVRDAMNPPNRRGTLEEFNDRWNFPGDWKRGGRFECDETGWPTAKAIGTHKDKNGVVIRNGDVRYLYRHGNLMRGVVRTNMNGMWTVGDFACVGSSDLFLCDPTTMARRHVPGQPGRLRRELEKALKRNDYRRVGALSRVLDRMRGIELAA